MQQNYKKILIVRLSSLGDILLTTPVIRALKIKYPGSEIDFVCKEQFIDAVKYNPHLSNKYIYVDEPDFYSKLQERKYDLILDLHNNFRSRKISQILKVETARFQKPSIRKFLLVKFKINRLLPVVSIPERYASALNGLKLDGKGLELFLPENISSNLNDGKQYIGICPGSQHFTKQYPIDYQKRFAELLLSKGFTPVLFGGSSDREVCAEIASSVNGVIDLSNDNDLFKTAADMKKCKLLVCNDSGLMHTATALKLPVIAIFGSTVKEFGFSPYGTKNLVLENNEVTCRPCSHIGKSSCPKGHFNCMRSLTPEFLFDNFKSFYESVI